MKIVVVASLAYSLVNFRGALLQRLVRDGYDVVACAPDHDPAVIDTLHGWGIAFAPIPMDRAGLDPRADIATFAALLRLFRRERPAIVLAYTQKPIIYSGLAARIVGGIDYYVMVSGLGHAFSAAGSLRRRLLRRLVALLYRAAVAQARCVFVFNRDDPGELRAHHALKHQPVVQLPGSGVDLARFTAHPLPPGPTVFLLVARLMRDKGLEEFVAAARIVRKQWVQARFRIVGPLDPNPTGLSRTDIARWEAAGDVEYCGETRDVRPFLRDASVFVLPSFYREGLPRTILEAMGTGRAVITTNMPGCRDAVIDGTTGMLIPPQDSAALAEAMLRFRSDPTLAARMGAAGRTRAEADYAVEIVNDRILEAIDTHRTPPSHAIHAGQSIVGRAVAAVALVALAPVMALVGLTVFMSLGSPMLFKQVRAGRHGHPFLLRKFRTMRQAFDANGAALPDAARLTTTGRVLRRTRLDELPQLLSVLRGDMAIVGPRPLLPETIAAMGDAGRARGAVRPGLTGWAQINGNALLNDADKVALDRWYIANRSSRLNLIIIWRTIGTLLVGERVRSEPIKRAYASAADRSS